MAANRAKESLMQCTACGKPIEQDARFCRHCGARQVPAPRRKGRWQESLRLVFPRHSLQDDVMHAGQIFAGVLAVLGLAIGIFFLPAVGMILLLFSIAVLLHLLLRESTLQEIRTRGLQRQGSPARYHAARQDAAAPEARPPPPYKESR